MSNILDTYLSNHPVEPDANPATIIKSMAYYIEAVEYEKATIETAKAAVDAEVAEKSTTLDTLKAILKVETDADVLKEVERLKGLDK